MFQRYQDAMTIVQNTVSPISSLLLHVICFRTTLILTHYQTKKSLTKSYRSTKFSFKGIQFELRELLNDILKRHVLDRTLIQVYTIEFQKCGLLHVQMLIMLAYECKPREPSDYDRIVGAEIPDTTLDSILHRRPH